MQGVDNTVTFQDIENCSWDEPPAETFEEMNLKDDLLRDIYSFGFEKPSAIQARAVKPFLAGRNLVAQAQSGTGKTASFTIGILNRIDTSSDHLQAMVLANTRELSLQIHQVFQSFGNRLRVRSHVCVGGRAIRNDLAELGGIGKHVAVGTPGRIWDLITRGAIDPDYIRTWVLDEADEMLKGHFKQNMYQIFRILPLSVQTGLFSATLTDEVLELTRKFMPNPVHILVKKEQLTLEGIRQFWVNAEQDAHKLDILLDIYGRVAITQCIIYVSSRNKVDNLQVELTRRNFACSYLHGAMDSGEREIVMKEFRSGASRVLVCTDLLARGIDVPAVSVVINYDMPKDNETYIHRVGRSGRFGRKGVAVNFITDSEPNVIPDLMAYYATEIQELPDGDFLQH